MKRKKIEQSQEGKDTPRSKMYEEKHEQWRFFLIDFKNIVDYGGRSWPMPPETDDPRRVEQSFEWRDEYPYVTVEEQYSKDGYDRSILPQLLKYCPEEVTKLNETVRQLNGAVKDRNIEKVRTLLKEGAAYIDSFSGKAKK